MNKKMSGKDFPLKKKILFSCVTVCLLLSSCEFGFRLFFPFGYWDWPPELAERGGLKIEMIPSVSEFISSKNHATILEDRYLFWKLAPNSIIDVRLPGTNPLKPHSNDYTIITNSHGFRSPEIREEKSGGVFRIVALGDSATLGLGVTNGFPYPNQLEHLLNEKFPHLSFEVINMGVPGYSSFQGKILFYKEVKSLNPDLVTLCFGANDSLLVNRSDSSAYQKREGGVQSIVFALAHLKIFKWFRFHLMGFAIYERSKQSNLSPLPRVSHEELIENYLSIVNEARKSNIQVVIVERIHFKTDSEAPDEKAARIARVPFVRINPSMEKMIEDITAGNRYPELKEYFEARYSAALEKHPCFWVALDMEHPNGVGYRVMAEQIMSVLITLPSVRSYIVR